MCHVANGRKKKSRAKSIWEHFPLLSRSLLFSPDLSTISPLLSRSLGGSPLDLSTVVSRLSAVRLSISRRFSLDIRRFSLDSRRFYLDSTAVLSRPNSVFIDSKLKRVGVPPPYRVFACIRNCIAL